MNHNDNDNHPRQKKMGYKTCNHNNVGNNSASTCHPPETLEKATRALSHITPNSLSRIERAQIATALKNEFGDSAKNTYIEWVSNYSDYKPTEYRSIWKNAHKYNTTISTLYHHARQNGYKESNQTLSKSEYAEQQRQNEAMARSRVRREAEQKAKIQADQQRAQAAINEIIPLLVPANANSTNYLKNKKADGRGAYTITQQDIQKTHTARHVYPFSDIKKTALVIPLQNSLGECVSMQLIYEGRKRIVQDSIKRGSYSFIGATPPTDTVVTIYISEGYATANSALQADNSAFSVMAVDADGLPLVAEVIRKQYPNANIIIIADNDKSGTGQSKAQEASAHANKIILPQWIEGQAKSTDINDVHVLQGIDAVKQLLGVADVPAQPVETGSQQTPVPKNTVINQRYLGDSIHEICQQSKFIIVKSGMGTGKTTAVKILLKSLYSDENILFITPRKKLNYAIANDLGVFYYEDVKNEEDKDRQAKMVRRMAVTPQSLGALLKAHPDVQYKYIVMDESESIASMIVSSVTKDKADTLQALRNASQKAQHVIAMDAHLSRQSKKLMSLLSDDQPIKSLVNTNKSWVGFNADMLDGGDYVKRRDSNNALQEQAINDERAIAICSNSKSYCDSRYKVLSDLFPSLKILLITGEADKQAGEILAKPELIANFDIVIFSPAVSVGVSFDIENHVDEVFGVFPNVDSTGGSDDAIQSLARIRKPLDKKWTITLDDSKEIFSHAPRMPRDIERSMGDRLARAYFAGGVTSVSLTDAEIRVMELCSVCEHVRVHDKNNFNDNFLHRLGEMGIEINKVDIESINNDQRSKELADQHKAQVVQREIEIKTKSPRIDENKAERIKAKRKFRANEVTEQENNSYKRYVFESKYKINCDTLNDEQLDTYLDHDENGTIKKLINREIALSDKAFIKRLMKARVIGLGEKLAFKVDAIDDKLNTPMLRNILAYALPYTDGKEYTHQSLKRSALVQYIQRHYKEITALRVITLPKGWKQKPALLMNHLLEIMGYDHESKRIRASKGKKRVYVFSAIKNNAVETLYSRREQEGMDWITSTENIMNLYEQVVKEKPAMSDAEMVEWIDKKVVEWGW